MITPRAGRTTPSPDRDQRAVSDLGTLTDQREHWAATFAAHPRMYGADPSSAAIDAAQRFENAGVTTVLELGAGQGRDTLYFAKLGFDIIALDYANSGVDEIRATADRARLVERIIPVQHDVRDPLPFTDTTFDACYSHMLFCMALTNGELDELASEVHRVVRPGALVVYTVRNIEDAHYRTGLSHGDGMYEHGGFIVHFFDRALIEHLAENRFDILDVTDFNEGALPRRLSRVTMRRLPTP